jgi:hypothetical protein
MHIDQPRDDISSLGIDVPAGLGQRRIRPYGHNLGSFHGHSPKDRILGGHHPTIPNHDICLHKKPSFLIQFDTIRLIFPRMGKNPKIVPSGARMFLHPNRQDGQTPKLEDEYLN